MPTRNAVVLGALAVGLAGGALLRGAASPVRAGPQDRDPVEIAGEVTEEVIDTMIDAVVFPPDIDWDDPLLKARVIVFSGEVNRNTVHDAVSKLLHLDRQGDPKPIDLWIRTSGGWPDDAFALADAMRAVKSPVNTWALGSVDSAGALILAAGTGRRRVGPHTNVSLHFNEDEGGGPHSKDAALRVRKETFWRSRARLPDAFYPVTGEKSFYLSPAETVKFGVADEIFDSRPDLAPKPAEGK